MQTYHIQQLIRLAGLAQVLLAIGSLVVPHILNWNLELAKVRTLIKQLFWTYAAYILVFNLSFGTVSLFAFCDLTNGSKLATLVTGFIAVYWISRLSIQFFCFDRTDFPTGKLLKLGEVLLVTCFIFLSLVYSLACYVNFKMI